MGFRELRDDHCIRSIHTITTTDQIHPFVDLWPQLQDVVLDPVISNSIAWTASSLGSYSAASAYHLQFAGATVPSWQKKVWHAKVEPKCKIFMWLLLHRKALTADRLAIRGCSMTEFACFVSPGMKLMNT